MSKSKKNSDNKTYSFTVDSKDPKYQKLIDFLEGIDSGARSFIIRQILNSYVNSQTATPLFGLVTEKPRVSSDVNEKAQPVQNPKMETPPSTSNEKSVVENKEKTNEPERQVENENKSNSSTNTIEPPNFDDIKPSEEKNNPGKKKNLPPQLQNLKNVFG